MYIYLSINICNQALGNLGFSHYIEEAKDLMKSAKNMALKKRKGSSKLENLGIPEEVLYKQQQELFAKVFKIKFIY